MTNDFKIPDLTPDFINLYQAANGMKNTVPAALGAVTLNDTAINLQTVLGDPEYTDLDALLATQSRLLDSLFSRSVAEGVTPESFNESRVNLALRAQKQCRATIAVVRKLRQADNKAHMETIKNATNKLIGR